MRNTPLKEDWLVAGGEMGRLIWAMDWSQTPLGPIAEWPAILKSTLGICLTARFPMAIYWGDDLCLLYNDAWRPIVGNKHPWSMGRPGVEVWPEIWDSIHPLFVSVRSTGEATWRGNELLPMQRYGYTEECYFDYTFNPIRDENGTVSGILNVVQETTYKVLNDRRMNLLRELSHRSGSAKSDEEAFEAIMAVLASDPADIPFAIIYSVDADGKCAHLIDATGLPNDSPARVNMIDLASARDTKWPLASALDRRAPILVDDLCKRFGAIKGTFWPEPTSDAFVAPLAVTATDSLALIVGINPRRQLEDTHRHFLDNVRSHVTTAITNARAYAAERKRAEALVELDRAKTAFFSNVSHEFRTPLTLMLGPVEELLSKSHTDLAPAAKGQLEVVNRNGLRLLRLVNSLLDFSRIEAGRIQAAFEATNLAAFTEELASCFRSATERAGLRLIVDCPPLSEPVYVDRDMWEKIVLNLLSNAFKFTFEGTITVAIRQRDGIAELIVRDTGVGIPAEAMPRLFERFYRVANMRSRTHEGSGIGLALVQELVKLHGGSVRATSVIGEGTTFIVNVPLGKSHLPANHIEARHSQVSTAMGAAPFVEEALRWLPEVEAGDAIEPLPAHDNLPIPCPPANQETTIYRPFILVVDDNADMRQYIARLLAERYRVATAADGEAALTAVREQRPDLILSDVMMPRLDGLGLVRKLRSESATQTVPVILLSARAGEESRIEGLEHGADDYLIKPFSARELLARVQAHLELARVRREAEREITDLQAALLRAEKAAKAGLWEVELPTLKMTWSPAYYELFGLSPSEEASYATWIERIHPGDRAMAEAEFRRSIEQPGRHRFSFRIVRTDGVMRWICRQGDAVFDDMGLPVCLSGISLDITDQKQAEEALLESELKFRTITEVSPQVVWTIDASGRLTYLNPYWTQYSGLTLEQMQQLPLGALLHPDDHERVMAAWEYSLMTGEPFSVEQRLRSKDGSYRWFLGKGAPIRNEQGETERWMGICVDITERKEAETALRENEQHLELLSNTVPALIFYLGPDRCYRTCNEAFTAWFGLRREQIIGLHVRALVGEEAWALIGPRLDRAYAGETIEYEVEAPFRLGGTRWIHAVYTPHRDPEGTVLGIVVLVTDITRAKHIEKALQEKEERLRTFAGKLEELVQERTQELVQSQDRLRALATELNLTELRERKRLAAELHDHLQQMLVLGKIKLGQGKRLAEPIPACGTLIKETDEVLSDALKYTRTLVAELSPPVLNDHGLTGALKWLAESMRKHDLAVSVNVPEVDLKLPEDQAALLFQSVRELLINSWKHSGTGQATVTLERHDGRLQIAVRDEGTGFDLAAAAAADTPNGSLSSKFGLFSIRERMKALGGRFDLQSTPGQGTTATLTLPLHARDERDARDKRDAQEMNHKGGYEPVSPFSPVSRVSHSTRIRVLLVDDHAMVRQGLRSVLDAYKDVDVVGEAGDGQEAVAAVERLLPTVVLMDINMPKMNGIEATAKIKAEHPEITVIGLSVNANADNQEAMMKAGATMLLTKEAAVDELYRVIQKALVGSDACSEGGVLRHG